MGFSKNLLHGTHNIQDGGDPQSWILTPKCKYAMFSKTKKFKGVYWRPIGSYVIGLFKESIIAYVESKMAEIRHLENRHDVIFAEGGPIWIKFRRLVQNDVSTAVMWSKSKPDVEIQYGGRLGEFNGMSSQSHVSHCRVLPLGEYTVTIPEQHAKLQGV